MTVAEFVQAFEKASEDKEFLKFERIPVEERLSGRPDLHAFLLLDKLVPGTSDMVAWAGHDEIALAVSVEELAKASTVKTIVDLHRCGVRCESDEYLKMFV